MTTEPKRVGCCSWCDAEVYEVVTRYGEGPLAGFPRQLKGPLPGAHQVHYVLVDGSRCALTSCAACLGSITDPANLPSLWERVIVTFVFEERDDVRTAMPSPPRTAEQKQANQAGILRLMTNPPLGVLAVTSLAP